jgi:hypothetical protein
MKKLSSILAVLFAVFFSSAVSAQATKEFRTVVLTKTGSGATRVCWS